MQTYIITTYIIAGILFLTSLFLERKITVLDLFIAVILLAIPFLNAIAFFINLMVIMNNRKVLNFRKFIEGLVKVLNFRIK